MKCLYIYVYNLKNNVIETILCQLSTIILSSIMKRLETFL